MFEIVSWSRDGKVKKDGEPSVLYHVRFNGMLRTVPLAELGKFVQNVMPAKEERQTEPETPVSGWAEPVTNHH